MDPVSYSPVLAALPLRDLEHLAERSVERVLHPDEILHHSGEVGERVHLVLSGVLKHLVGGPLETIVGLSVEGDLVGDLALVNDHRQPYDTMAATESVLLGFEIDVLRETLGRHPAAGLALASTFATRIRWMAAATEDRSGGPLTERLAGRLLDLAELLGRMNGGVIDVELPLFQRDLGRLAGMSRESTCKTMRRFRSAGVLDYNGRHLRILRPEVLHHIMCEGRAARLSR
jgi:CRP-like cAMP-binding protein